jgi:hypothetical protein
MPRRMWTYYGVNVDPIGANSWGGRWVALVPGHGYLKADTKEGMRELIRHTR